MSYSRSPLAAFSRSLGLQVEIVDTLRELLDESLGRGADLGAPVQVEIDKADGVRCERCWRYVPTVSDDPAFRGLCERCVDALAETVQR